jgi:DNA-binding response OmpR family regulator
MTPMTSTLDPKPTVLVVDDSEICLELAREALEASGFRVVTTTSALGVNRLITSERPAVIVVDVTMPALRGDKLVQLVRRYQTNPVPILLHSDRPPEELSVFVRESGATGFVEKTPDGESLVRAVRAHTRQSRAR